MSQWKSGIAGLAVITALALAAEASAEPVQKAKAIVLARATATEPADIMLPRPRPATQRILPAPIDPRVTAPAMRAAKASAGPAQQEQDAALARATDTKAAKLMLPRPRPWSQRILPAPVDPRVTAATIEPDAFQRRQVACLAKAIYFEARGESLDGQYAVARVVINRTKSKFYPDTICRVVYQNAHLRNRCQFSFACDGQPDEPEESIAWALALGMAAALVRSEQPLFSEELLRSTNYHADYVRPRWAARLAMTGTVGRHIFYIENR